MSPRLSASELAAALGGKRSGTGWRARCPAHDDHDPSLDIIQRNGKVLFNCRAGCSQDAVLDALKARGLWADRRNGEAGDSLVHPQLGAPHVVFEYHTAAGTLIGTVCRWNKPDGKEIRPATLDGGEWRWKAFAEPRPLYRLPDIVAHSEKAVLIVEGEKAADAAAELLGDLVVTTWPGGAKAVAKVDLSPLKDRDVLLWPDNDPEGKQAMRALVDRLTAARSVRGVKLPDGLPPGWDLADRMPEGLDPCALVRSAVKVRVDRLAELKLISAADLVQAEFKEPRWAVPGIVPDGCSLLAGRPKTGKSWLALDIGVAVASGSPAMGNIDCDEGDVLAILLEDTPRRLHGRLKAVLQGAPAPCRLQIATAWKRADAGGLEDIRAWLAAHPDARLVIIDTLAKIRGRPDKDKGVYQQDYDAITAIKAIADQTGVAILLVHHLRKEGASDPLDAVSGTAGITGAVDTVIVLTREPSDPHGLLYVRGRDVHEQELALEFDNETGKWRHIGSGREFRMSEERKAVIEVLRQTREPMSPAAIASALGKNGSTVRMLLAKMLNAGEVSKMVNGKYWVAP